ncbi:nb-arc and ankyrin domain protein [Fusarium tjaetaba]|uniref:Nb-arc and ankyrin domain protein n=1 Tax=Fusarium tjaetaba TaxID=1567544 RepID=A0A8H5VH87_9HYPO|nr:nb-arc and ankyrin domain protein [Fusarium tjaetaba]KAF5624632.1 nb-arc and ankyrin domain protein [Fusarium tjaetaba]
MSMSIYAGAYGYMPKPELEGILTDPHFRIIFIHGLNSPCTGVGGTHDDSEAVGLKPIKSPFELPLAIEAYTFYHEGNLLEDVDQTGFSHGSSSDQSDRRTILICHGSGGLIVKEALLRSVIQSDPEQAFHQLILGLIFIGTPHSTADERLPYQLNLMRNNQGPDSPALSMKIIASITTLLRGFNSLDWSRLGFKPVSLFEEVGLPDAPEAFGPVVNCEDVFIRGQRQIGLHANHWSTWNFSDPSSSTYKAISTIIQSFCHDLTSSKCEGSYPQMDPDISGLLRSLQVTSTESFSTPMQGTCLWIFQHEAFGSWLEQPSGLLWIKGKPGSGKSTLLRFIHQTVKFSEPTSLFFFQFNTSGHSSTNAMLRSLIFQLLARRPCYQLQGMRDTYAIRTEVHGDYGADWQWGDPELLSYLRESLLQATKEDLHLVIFLDALDEATEDMPIDSIILNILTIPSIRICAASRSGPNLSNVEPRTIILDDLNTADIIYYTKSMVSSVDYKGADIQRRIIPSLIEASDGMFLYVHLVLSNLEIWIDQLEGQDQSRAGHIDFPKGLDDLYCLIVSRIESSLENRDLVRHIFQWVAFATRPLIVTELTDAMALGSLDGYDFCRHSRKNIGALSGQLAEDCDCAQKITSLCRGLVSIQYSATDPEQSVVSFIHQSVVDFLVEYKPCEARDVSHQLWGRSTQNNTLIKVSPGGIPATQLVLQEPVFKGQGHKALARSCCRAILSATRSRREGFTDSYSFTFSFLSYAAENWMLHLRIALELEPSSSELLLDLSQNAFFENSLALYERIISSHKKCPRLTHISTTNTLWEAKQSETSNPLLLASAIGHVETCKRYIYAGKNYDDRDHLYGMTALGWAAVYGHLEVVRLLLNAGADVNLVSNGETPLLLAVRSGRNGVLEQLLKERPVINSQATITTQSALFRAASLGRTSMINLLISHGADALTADGSGWTPLHYAIAAGKRATLAQLLSTIPRTSFERLKDLPPRNLPGWVHRILLAFGLGLCCRSSGCSSSSAKNSGSKNSENARKRGRQGSKKRGRESTENMDENDEQSMAPPPQKQSRHAFGLRFACPYNKRCPNRFGGACSNFGFPDMHRLKEHLFRCHFLGCDKRTRCGRCKLIFPESEIQDHLILEVACEPTRVAVNYEDGFDTNQSDALKSLKPKQFKTPVLQWEKTFNTVFPDWTADLPSPYHETSETECRIRVAQTLRSEEFRQEVWSTSDMGREVFEGLANILDPLPRASTRPDSQPLRIPNELPMRPALARENGQTALNAFVANLLPTDPQRGTVATESLPAIPAPNPSPHPFRPIPPQAHFPPQFSDTPSHSIFSGAGSISSFCPGQESMYGDGNDASISSLDWSYLDVQMTQSSMHPVEFNFDAPTSINASHSSRHENQPKRNPGTSTSVNIQPAEYGDATPTIWFPSRRDN